MTIERARPSSGAQRGRTAVEHGAVGRRGLLVGAGAIGAGVAAVGLPAPATADTPTAVFFGSGAFVPPSTGVFPGYELAGLAFDEDDVEKAAVWLTAPATWSSVTVYIVGTSASTGTAQLHIEIPSPQTAVELEVSTSFGLVRQPLVTDHSFYAITGTDLQGIPAALLRDADAGADDLDDDFVVWGLELVEGA